MAAALLSRHLVIGFYVVVVVATTTTTTTTTCVMASLETEVDAALNVSYCNDPLSSILHTFRCVEERNVSCATAGYNNDKFQLVHNDVLTDTKVDANGTFWTQAFLVLQSLRFNLSDARNLGPNLAHVRYVETSTFTNGTNFGLPPSHQYPFGQVHAQHEDALVTTDNDCRILLWNQYGDNAEQAAVANNVDALVCSLGSTPPSGATCPPSNSTGSTAPSSSTSNSTSTASVPPDDSNDNSSYQAQQHSQQSSSSQQQQEAPPTGRSDSTSSAGFRRAPSIGAACATAAAAAGAAVAILLN